MSKKLAASLSLALFLVLSAEAIPSSFVDPVEGVSGWLTMGLRWFLPIDGDRNVCFEFCAVSPQRTGIGLEVGRSGLGKGIMLAVSGLYFLDPFPTEYFTVPLKLRLGGMSTGTASNWFASLSVGTLIFAPRLRYDDPADPKEVCLTAGVDGELYFFDRRLFPTASFSVDFAGRLGPKVNSSGYYYVYY